MGWIERDADKHKHNTPTQSDSKTRVGDRWRCTCGKVFKVTKAKTDYDQRDHSSWTVLEWAEETPQPYQGSIAEQRDGVYYGPYGYGTPFGS